MAATLNNNSTAPAKNGKASTAGKQESVVELKDAKSKAPVRPNKDAHERAMNELGAKIDRLKARSVSILCICF